MATITKFEDLDVWKKARLLSVKIYNLTFLEPLSKDYRLKDQMRGSAGPIMDNITEGFDRGGRLEFINSLGIAKDEAGELKSQLYRRLDILYIIQDIFKELYTTVDEVAKMIASFIEYLNKSEIRGQKFKNR